MTPKAIRDVLERFQGVDEMVEYCPWDNAKGLLVGFVKEVTKKEVVFHLVDTCGRFSRTETERLKDIVFVGYHTAYLRKLETLWRNEEWQARTFDPKTAKGKKSIPAVLAEALDQESAVCVYENKEDKFYALVREMSPDAVLFEVVNQDTGEVDGFKVMALKAVQKVRMAGCLEESVATLHRLSKAESAPKKSRRTQTKMPE